MTADFREVLNEDEAARAKYSRLLHDLRGPLINIEGFSGELSKALGRITELLRDNEAVELDDFVHELQKIVDKDVEPCLDFLMRSVGKANENLDIFASQVACLKNET